MTPKKPVLAWILMVLMASQLVALMTGLVFADYLAKSLVVLFPLIAWRSLGGREIYLFSLCFILLGLAWISDLSVLEISEKGLSRAAFLASFILLMALLREGAITSPSVERIGHYLTLQRPGRRFLSIFAGSHFFAVLTNLGSLSLLGPIIQRGIRASLDKDRIADEEIIAIRERRQLSAVLRGFCWFLLWAPTAVTQAVMPTLMAGINTVKLMTTGLVLALIMMVVSWLEDLIRWRGVGQRLRNAGRLPKQSPPTLPLSSFGNLAIVCLFLFGLSALFAHTFSFSIVSGVMVTAPIVVIIWVWLQYYRTAEGNTGASRRMTEIAYVNIPGFIREAVFLGCAGFIGTLAALLVPVEIIAKTLDLSNQPGWLFLWVLTVLVWLFGQIGLSPITLAVFLGSVVAELNALPVDITYAALAIAAGTAVCTVGAPFSSGAILFGRITGHSPFTLAWRWNGSYSLICLLVLAVFYWVLVGL